MPQHQRKKGLDSVPTEDKKRGKYVSDSWTGFVVVLFRQGTNKNEEEIMLAWEFTQTIWSILISGCLFVAMTQWRIFPVPRHQKHSEEKNSGATGTKTWLKIKRLFLM